MRSTRLIVAAALLMSACATEQMVTLLPRGTDGPNAFGVLDRWSYQMTVTIEGRDFRGPAQAHFATSYSSAIPGFGRASTTDTNQWSALLLGTAGGHIRCDFAFNTLSTYATGVCTDSRNITYDLMIKQ